MWNQAFEQVESGRPRRRVPAAALAALFVALSGPAVARADEPPAAVARDETMRATVVDEPLLATPDEVEATMSSDRESAIDPLIKRVAGRTVAMMRVRGDAMNLWDWESGIAIAGLMYAYEASGDETILREVAAWTDTRLAEGVKLTHINHTTPAWGVLMLYERRPEARYRAVVDGSVQFLLDQAPRVHGTLAHVEDQLWDDSLIVSVPLLARYGARFDCRPCLDQAVDEYLAHARRLQDPRSGRWYHGWDASDFRQGRSPHLSGAHWARGNGWAALAATELLRWLPENHPQRREVMATLGRQLRGLLAMQDASGLWHTVVTRPDFYLEASGSAAISAAVLRAVSAGWVEPGLAPFGLAGREAVRARVAADGTLTEVSTGTGVAPTIEVYNQVPKDQIKPYGQGLFLIMATAGVAP